MSDPFGYGYAVSHSEPSALIPLMGYVSYVMVMVMVIIMVIERLWFYMALLHPFGYGYAVSHSQLSALIPLIGLYIFHIGYGHGHGIVMVIERLWFYMVI